MNTATARFEAYFFPVDLENRTPEDSVELWCVDDRPGKHIQAIPENRPGAQYAGSVLGLAQDLTVATIMSNGGELPSGFITTESTSNLETVDVTAKIITRVLRHEGVLPSLHENCAAEQGALTIANYIAEGGDKLWSVVQRIDPGIEKRDFNLGITATGALLNQGLIRGADQAASCMGRRGRFQPIPRGQLIESPHISDTILVNGSKNRGFDTWQAFFEGNPAYHVSAGALPKLAELVESVIPSRPEPLRVASVLRHAGVALHLPHPEGKGDEFDILHVN